VLAVLRLEAGLVLRPVVGEVPGDAQVARRGPWLSAGAGLGWRF
jgi:hypothetical protein